MFYQKSFNSSSVVGNLIIINVLAFIATLIMGNIEFTFCERFSNVNEKLVYFCGLYLPSSELFKPWQLLTHLFLHGGFMHLFFNMYALFMFGTVLEQVWGPKRFLSYYLITGFGASAFFIAVKYFQLSGADPLTFCVQEHVPVIGASGAVFGLLLAYGMLFPNAELMLLFVPFPIKAKYFVIGYGVIELYMGLKNSTDGVAHFAHIGGMVFGFFLVKYWQKNSNHFY